jgi:hypothetical protein
MVIYFVANWNILGTFGIFNDQLVHFVFIYTFFQFWYNVGTKKNLATMEPSGGRRECGSERREQGPSHRNTISNFANAGTKNCIQ